MLTINTKLVEDANLSIDDMAKYLRENSWKELPGTNKHAMVFQGINDDFGNPLTLILPRNNKSDNALRYLAQAVDMVAFLNNCSIKDTLVQIKGTKTTDYSEEQQLEEYERRLIIQEQQLKMRQEKLDLLRARFRGRKISLPQDDQWRIQEKWERKI
jgi:hypothetical protein